MSQALITEGDRALQAAEYARAVDAYGDAVRSNPDDRVALRGLIRALYEDGRFSEAASMCRQSLRLMPTEALPHLILGKIAAAEHRFAEAESELSQALNLEPASAEAIFALGGVRFSVDDYGGAIALFEKALQLAPDSHQGHSLLGTAYQYADRHSDAVREHKRAFELKRSLANFGLLCYAYYLKHRLLVLAVSILAALASIITAYPPPGMAVLVFILLLGLVNFAYGSRSRGLAIWLLALGLVALYILSRAWRMP